MISTIEKTKRSVRNRINESKNKQGIAVTIALSTLTDMMRIITDMEHIDETKRERDVPKEMIRSSNPLHAFCLFCPTCRWSVNLSSPHAYCSHCGQAIKEPKK